MLTRINEKYTLSFPAVVDAGNLSEFFSHLEKIKTLHTREIFLDFSRVEVVSARYVAILCQAHSKLREAGIVVHLESVPDELREILQKYNILNLFEPVAGNRQFAQKDNRDTINDGQRMIELSFQPNTSDISHALNVYKIFLNENDIFELEAFELITVFYEVATNIRLHANLACDARIDFSALLYGMEILMRFEDPGMAFDPGTVLHNFDPGQASKSGKRRGLGLVLVNRLIDSLSYMRSDNGKNILCLKKNLSNGGGENDTSSGNK